MLINILCIQSHFRIDYEATVKAAQEAQSSAQIAQNNAAEAGAKASISTLTEAHGGGASSYSHISHQGYDVAASNNNDQTAKPSNQSHNKQKAPETIASNHNYGNPSDFKPSKPFNFAGY
jgi:hypothetical protein